MSPLPPRFLELYQALDAARTKKTGFGAFFEDKKRTRLALASAAALMLGREGDADALAKDLTAALAELDKDIWLGGFLRHWPLAAALQFHQRSAASYKRLKQPPGGPKPQLYRRDIPLLMTLLDAPDSGVRDRFFKIQEAFTPSVWKRGAVFMWALEFYGAFHAVRGSTPEEIAARREPAEAVFEADRRGKKVKLEAGWLATVLERDPTEFLDAFTAMEAARRADRKLRGPTSEDRALFWAALGVTPDALPELTAIMAAIPKDIAKPKPFKAGLAEIIWLRGKQAGLKLDAQGEVLITAVLNKKAEMMVNPPSDGGGGGGDSGGGGG